MSFAATAAGAPLSSLLARQALAGVGTTTTIPSPYGPVAPVADLSTGLELLSLPAGFRYRSFSWTNDLMSDGTDCPRRHDGMGVVKQTSDRGEDIILVRNHELGGGATLGPAGTPTYDSAAGGGTTTLRFRKGLWVSDHVSLAGTHNNCAGGATPWGSWLSCEESSQSTPLQHGYVFEVPADSPASAVPIVEMGQMKHEAAVVDAHSGYVYLTEDENNCGFYRFVPDDLSGQVGSLENGGTLQMCRALDSLGVPIDNLKTPLQGEVFDVTWVDVDPADPFGTGKALDATTFRRGEGAHYSTFERAVYWSSTTGGAAAAGAVFRYRPPAEDPTGDGKLEAYFVSDGLAEASGPDNITVSVNGGVLVCEDGASNPMRLLGLTSDGCTYEFLANNVNLTALEISGAGKNVNSGDYRDIEFTGVSFDPEGRYLFLNIQNPGITFAISGPWNLGPL